MSMLVSEGDSSPSLTIEDLKALNSLGIDISNLQQDDNVVISGNIHEIDLNKTEQFEEIEEIEKEPEFYINDSYLTVSNEIYPEILKEVKITLGILESLYKNKYDYNLHTGKYVYGDTIKYYSCDMFINIYYPKVTITNSAGQTHTINKLFIKLSFYFNSPGRIFFSQFSGTRLEMTTHELLSGYMHSHLPMMPLLEVQNDMELEFGSFCTGAGIFNIYKTSKDLPISSTVANSLFGLFTAIDSYIEWESLEGGPYIKMEDIEKKAKIRSSLTSKVNINNIETININKSVLKYILKNGKFSILNNKLIILNYWDIIFSIAEDIVLPYNHRAIYDNLQFNVLDIYNIIPEMNEVVTTTLRFREKIVTFRVTNIKEYNEIKSCLNPSILNFYTNYILLLFMLEQQYESLYEEIGE